MQIKMLFFEEDKPYIYLISDPVHLEKTARNCLNKSGSAGNGTHFMWNGGLFLIENHLIDIFWKMRNVNYDSYPR